ncbi:MAG: RNA polymerase factor sigma-54 [Flavobacteriales bacterium]|nr:RNA polymerase factor sigma-54 [Flavobacteriales bacterium]MDG1933991.1 RNA polymerase factor sigma-54 [Flavobacteriales bacterium]
MNKQRLVQKQYQNLSPQQIQFLSLLQTPIVSLEKRIEEELENNPALEEDEHEEINQPLYQKKEGVNNFEEHQIVEKNESLENYLINQLIDLNLEDDIKFLVKYLINSIDKNGFLNRDLYSISSDILINHNENIEEKKLDEALTILKSLEPIGIGSKNLQECLLIQLKTRFPNEEDAYNIILHHYSSFSNKNYEFIIKKIGLSKIELRKIYELIAKLQPIPSTGFSSQSNTTKYIYSDFTISTINNEIELQINKANTKPVKTSNYYSALLNETKDSKTKEFLSKKIEQANWFKEAIIKREHTLKIVMQAIIKLQKDYFLSGAESDLKPMKLSDIAEMVNMDISTISRVSNSKYIETQFGTFKVKELFSEAYIKESGEIISTNVIKNKLKELIAIENKLSPLTDEQLTRELSKHEFNIARRTVSKYREILNIKTAKLRREI